MKKLFVIAAMIAAFGLGGAAAFAASADKPPSPPGQGECEHGNSQKPCKDDPQPNHGQDCDEHGNQGGVNEDHCLNDTTDDHRHDRHDRHDLDDVDRVEFDADRDDVAVSRHDSGGDVR